MKDVIIEHIILLKVLKVTLSVANTVGLNFLKVGDHILYIDISKAFVRTKTKVVLPFQRCSFKTHLILREVKVKG